MAHSQRCAEVIARDLSTLIRTNEGYDIGENIEGKFVDDEGVARHVCKHDQGALHPSSICVPYIRLSQNGKSYLFDIVCD